MTYPTGRSYRWLFLALVVVGLALDQGSKYGIFAYLHEEAIERPSRQAGRELVPGVFALTASFTSERDQTTGLWHLLRTASGAFLPHVNRGALFGIGHGKGNGDDSNFLFLLVSLGAAVAIGVWATRPTGCRDGFLSVALGLILAGTLGNLYDRVVFDGVRDFLYWYYLVNWPVFNLADCCLVCGAGLLLWQALGNQTAGQREHAEVVLASQPAEAQSGVGG